jgi:hypothetical protein
MLAPNWNIEMYLKFLNLALQKNAIEYTTRSLKHYTICVKITEFRREINVFVERYRRFGETLTPPREKQISYV